MLGTFDVEQGAILFHVLRQRYRCLGFDSVLCVLTTGIHLDVDVKPWSPQARQGGANLPSKLAAVHCLYAGEIRHVPKQGFDFVGLQTPYEMPCDISGKLTSLLHQLLSIVLAWKRNALC